MPGPPRKPDSTRDRIRLRHLGVVALLLLGPFVAGWRFWGFKDAGFLLAGYAFASGVTYFLYADDKQRARSSAWRAPENILHLFELAGGWPGAFLAQRWIRHKNAKWSYQFAFWLIVGIHQFVALDALLDWRVTRGVITTARSFLAR